MFIIRLIIFCIVFFSVILLKKLTGAIYFSKYLVALYISTINLLIYNTAKELGDEFNLAKGANNYSFIDIAKKMKNQR